MKKQKVCIVIPVYYEQPNVLDTATMTQLDKVIGNKYDIYIVCPAELNLSEWKKLVSKPAKVAFDKEYFNGYHGYSQLCISKDFYGRFLNLGYDYMCLFQTDVWLFKDGIQEFADMEYDYIGAPILSRGSLWKHVPAVGNGGFSLRKLSVFKDICDPEGVVRKTYKDLNKQWDSVDIEDKFLCDHVRGYYNFSVPDINTAFEFAWDQSVEYIYKEKTKEFPVAAHAVDKTLYFWIKYIPELNTPDIINLCLERYTKIVKDIFKDRQDMIDYNVERYTKRLNDASKEAGK